MKWPSFFSRKEVKAPPAPKLADAYHKIEQIVKDIELVKYMLEDTKDFQKIPEAGRVHSRVQLENFWERTHFQASGLRDEMLLTLQRMPNVRLVRKKVDVEEKPQQG